jgi:hypothetical protein
MVCAELSVAVIIKSSLCLASDTFAEVVMLIVSTLIKLSSDPSVASSTIFNVSLPSLPSIESFATEKTIVSLPAPASMLSLPPPPAIVSLEGPPTIVSA